MFSNRAFYIIPVVAFIFYILSGPKLIAKEIEDPFTGDASDVPTELPAQNILRYIPEIF